MCRNCLSPRVIEVYKQLHFESNRVTRTSSSSPSSAEKQRIETVQLVGRDSESRVESVLLSTSERLVVAVDRSSYAIVGDSGGDERFSLRIYVPTRRGIRLVYEDAPVSPRVHPFGCGFLWVRRDASLRPGQIMWNETPYDHDPVMILSESNPARRLDVRGVDGNLGVLVSRGISATRHWIAINRPNTSPEVKRIDTGSDDVDVVPWHNGTVILDRSHRILHTRNTIPFRAGEPQGFVGQYIQPVSDGLVVTGRKDSRFAIWAPLMDHAPVWIAPPAGTMVPSIDSGDDNLALLVSSPVHRPQVVKPHDPGEVIAASTGHAACHRLYANSFDGTRIPVTLFLPCEGIQHALVVQVYGAYGISLEGPFDPFTDLLFSRGVAVAYCHVRGGGENGPGWHLSALGAHHERSLCDLFAGISLLRHYPAIDPNRIVLSAASAGGLIAATACLRKPTWLRGLHLVHPFIDPLGTLMDPNANLAASDLAEFGDPRKSTDARNTLERLSPIKLVSEMHIRSAPLPRAWIRGARSDARVNTNAIRRFAQLYRSASSASDPSHVVCRVSEGGHIGGLGEEAAYRENMLSHAWLIDALEVWR